MTTALRAALYARVSTEDQAEKYGLSSQLHELRALATRKEYVIIGEFVDAGISGATLERPDLTRLRDAVAAKSLDVVLTYGSDRLARSVVDFLLLRREFRRAGVALEYVGRSSEDSPHGLFQEQVLAAVDELERAVIRQRTTRGRLDQARKGIMPGGPVPYGYRLEPGGQGGYAVDETEAAVVRRIFAWFLDGTSIRTIARRLTTQGLRPRRSDRWATGTIHRILTGSLYVGQTFYNRRLYPETGPATPTLRAAADWIAVATPAIVTPETFGRVAAARERNQRLLTGRPPATPYLLRGLLICGTCGRHWHGCTTSGRRRYRCWGRDRQAMGAPCRSPAIAAARLETATWDRTAGILRSPKMLITLIRQHGRLLDAERADRQEELRGLRRQLARIEDQQRRLLDLYLDGGLEKAIYVARTRPLAAAEAKVRVEVERLDAALSQRATTAHEAAAVRQAHIMARGLDRLDAAGRQQVVRRLLERVVVEPNQVIIHGLLPMAAERRSHAFRAAPHSEQFGREFRNEVAAVAGDRVP